MPVKSKSLGEKDPNTIRPPGSATGCLASNNSARGNDKSGDGNLGKTGNAKLSSHVASSRSEKLPKGHLNSLSATQSPVGDQALGISASMTNPEFYSNTTSVYSPFIMNGSHHARSASPAPSMALSTTSQSMGITQHPQVMSGTVVPPPAAFYDPDSWMRQFKTLRASTVKNKDLIALGHKSKAVVTTKSAVRSACIVRVLPNLDTIKAALRKSATDRRKQRYDMWESSCATSLGRWEMGSFMTNLADAESASVGRASSRGRSVSPRSQQLQKLQAAERRDAATKLFMPPPAVWTIAGVNDSEVNIYEAFSGRPLMRIRDPKANVPAVSLLHAPFRGFMNRQLKVLPIHEPSDLLRIKPSQLIETDWVWVGFTDGSIRLFPANPSRIRDSDRAEQFSKGELADLVFELPKYHNASIVAITRSPCHRDEEGADLSTLNRLSTAVQYMTAAGAEDSEKSREHLSLMCTASVDSSIVIWDVRKIYQTLEAMRLARKEAMGNVSGAASTRMSTSGRASAYYAGSVYASETITLEGFATQGEGGGAAFTVRSSCTMIKVRPLMRLKGGVASLKSLQWVSTLVSTEHYVKRRREAEMTRDPEEPSAPRLIRDRRGSQAKTRFDRREEHRRALRLSELDMREVEEELERMMPPLLPEPVQSLRVNLIVASDNTGTVHIWNLDEELMRKMNDPFHELTGADSARHTPRQQKSPRTGRSAASESPGRSSVGACSAISPSVQLSAIDGPTGPRLASARHRQRQEAAADGRASASVISASLVPGSEATVATSTGNPALGKTPKRKKSTTSTGTARPGVSTMTPKRATRPTAMATPGGKKPSATGDATGTKAKRKATGGTTRPSASMARGQHSLASSRGPSVRAGTVDRRGRSVSMEAGGGGETPAPMSRMQMLAMHMEDRHTPIREMNKAMNAPVLLGSESPEEERAGRRSLSLPQPSARKRTGRKAASRPRHGGDENNDNEEYDARGRAGAFDAFNSPRASARMPSQERVGVHFATADGFDVSPRRRQKSPSATPGAATANPRRSPSRRGHSAEPGSQQRAMNDYLSRASRCRLEFTGGVAITGMAVDVPPRIDVTLRRLPDPEERQVSLLEEPTPEEVERRVLENSFEELTEDKALFFAFQQLQMYLAVEGTVLNLRSVPVWQRLDEDDRDLFAQRGIQESERTVAPQQLHKETVVDGTVELTPAFSIHLRKLVLETHSQPVTELFLDHGRGHVWVARNDGLLSLFSKHTKKIVTRVPHPCADLALGPPNQKEWRAEQRDLVEAFASGAPRRLEWHKECRAYDTAAYFSELVPFGRRTQVSLLMTANVVSTATASAEQGWFSGMQRIDSLAEFGSVGGLNSPQSPTLDGFGSATFTPSQQQRRAERNGMIPSRLSVSAPRTPVPYALSSLMRLTSSYVIDGERVTKSLAAISVDGCSDLSTHARRREERLSTLLHQLLWCRGNAEVVRRAQKAFYESLCDAIADHVRYVITEIGAYSTLSLAHRSYNLWCQHAHDFPRLHTMRKQRSARLAHSAGVAAAMGRAVQMQCAAGSFRHWFTWTAVRRETHNRVSLTKVLAPVRQDEQRRARRLTAAMFAHLVQTQQRCILYDMWLRWTQDRHVAKRERQRAEQAQRQQETPRRSKSFSASPLPTEDSTDNGLADSLVGKGVTSVLASPEVHGLETAASHNVASTSSAGAAALSERQTVSPNALGDENGSVSPAPSAAGPRSSPGSRPSDSPRATSPLVRTFTRLYRTSASPPERRAGTVQRSSTERGSAAAGVHEDTTQPPVEALLEKGTTSTETPKKEQGAGATAPAALLEAHPFLQDFFDMLQILYTSRAAIMLFRESRNFTDSVLDESWMSIVESAEGAADTEDEEGRRLGVFSYGLLPLLQGLLSTAEDVLPNLNETSVADEVLSMLSGIQLCMDYVAADAEATAPLVFGSGVVHAGEEFFTLPETLYLNLLAAFAFRALNDPECLQAMKEIATEKESLEAFVAFVEDDRLDVRRQGSVPLP